METEIELPCTRTLDLLQDHSICSQSGTYMEAKHTQGMVFFH